MIKINLLNDRSKAKQEGAISNDPSVVSNSGTAFKDIFSGDDIVENDGQIGLVIKILIMIGFTAALYCFQRIQTGANKAKIAAKQRQVTEIESLLEDKKSTVEDFDTLKKKFQDERDFIKATKKELIDRMHFIRGLDKIQTAQSAVVPNLWLTSLTFENGSFKIDGQALYKSDLDSFYAKLNKILLFSNTIIVKDSEVKTQGDGVYEFSIVTETKKTEAKKDPQEEGV